MVYRHILECGMSTPIHTPLIVNGKQVEYGTFPWHVGIYRKQTNGNYEQICGGTLVKPDLVISGTLKTVLMQLHAIISKKRGFI